MARSPQLQLFKKDSLAYGGTLLNTRKGRMRGRPIDTKNTTHLILRSSKAKGAWSFKVPKNDRAIREIIEKFSKKYGIQIISLGNAGNHLHLLIKILKRQGYKPFIRAITSAIMMKVTGTNRWTKHSFRTVASEKTRSTSSVKNSEGESSRNPTSQSKLSQTITTQHETFQKEKFWDLRPFTRVVKGYKAMLTVKDYIAINMIEGMGAQKESARWIIKKYGRELTEALTINGIIKSAPG